MSSILHLFVGILFGATVNSRDFQLWRGGPTGLYRRNDVWI